MPREHLYLADIIAACDQIATFVSQTDSARFLSDDLAQSAVAFQFTIIGEAIANVTNELKQPYAEVRWADARRMRNLISHRYVAIDWQIIWDTAENSVPVLREQVEAILENEYPQIEGT